MAEDDIDDLEWPRLPPDFAAMADGAAAMADGLVFDLDALRDAAATRVGLDDFGNELYVEPYSVLLRSLDKESGLGPMGRLSVHSQLTNFLVNRLLLTDLLRRHPEIDDAPMVPPIVIAGLPRAGTTHLHSLIGSDPALRALPWWEALEPLAPPGEEGTVQPRIDRAEGGIAMRDAIVPHFKAMHEMTGDHVHEEIHLLAVAGSTMLFDTMGVLPSFREWYRSSDQTPYYLELVRYLKALQFVRPRGERWVLKSPQHLENYGPLMTAFPDATVVIPHRDPVAITASMATMICYTSRTSYAAPVPVERIAGWWATLIEQMLLACVRDRDLVPAAQSLDVGFEDYMADPIGLVEQVYTLAGQELTPTSRQAIEDYQASHERGRHGRVRYDLGALGINADERYAALAPYIDRFNVTV